METLLFRDKRLFALAILMVLAMGLSTLLTIGRQEDPTITNLFATILTPYPGASPDRVESLVTEKIEESLQEIAEIDEINSTSRTGISVVRVELSKFITDAEIEQTWSEIRDALSDAARQFPAGVPEPTFDDDRTGAYTAIGAIMARPGVDVPLSIVGRYAEVLQDRLRLIPGTDLVRLFGEPEEEILVTADPARLASLGLTIDQLSDRIASGDSKVGAGRVRGDRADYVIEVDGEIESLERVRDMTVVAGDLGPLTRVGDIADVRRSVKTPPDVKAYADGTAAVFVAARMEEDLQVDAWMAQVKDVVREFEATLPAGLEHRLVFDQSVYTVQRLSDLGQNLLIGVALVISVLFVTLGWRAALIVAVMLPLTSIFSVAILEHLGVPIHQMSVTGLIVALGLLVDASIVMTDEIRKRLDAGKAAVDAVGASVRRLAMPLFASTVTTVLAFMPMVLLPGPAGDFVGSIATAVIVMLVVSLVFAMTLTPALAGYLLPRGAVGDGRPWWQSGVKGGAIAKVFAASVDLSLRYRGLAILGALVLPLIGFGAFPTLTAQFFPGVERDQFYIQVKLPDGAALTETEATVGRIDAVLDADPDIAEVDWFIGESAPAFYYNMMMDQDGVPTFAEALVTTVAEEATKAAVPRLQSVLDRDIPEAQVIVREIVQGPPVAAPVEMRLVGPGLESLRSMGDEARALIAEIPEVTHTRSTLLGGAPKLLFVLDEDKVRLAGLELADVARQLEAFLEGATGGSLVEGTEELPVRVRLGEGDRSSVDRIASLDIMPPDGLARAARGAYPGIPLLALGSFQVEPSDSPIARRNGERINTIQAFLRQGVLPEEALKKVKELLAERPLPLSPGYRIEWGGDSDARQETTRNLMSSMGLIIALLVATIVITFRSFRLSLIAAIVTVLSLGLSLLTLAIFNYPFGIQGLIGVIGSIGVSINAAIIIMTAMQQDERANAGDPVAIRNVVLGAGRHIVSTTVTTFGGFLPLIIAGGAFWPPFAMAIAGGVLLSTVVSFYFVPPAFSLVRGRPSPVVTDEPREKGPPSFARLVASSGR